ncbi:MAG: hypothetical protein PHY02_01135 [Phycisphaerae bacterium]|nr:hypothetical protein [Phycisphaerae bacterium]
MDSIVGLESRVSKLKKGDKKLFCDIFEISSVEGRLEIPPSFRAKVRQYFGTKDKGGEIIETEDEVVNRIETQKVVRTFNKWTGDGALFNWLRASRPSMRGEIEKERQRVDEHISESMRNCDFCEPAKYTPEDLFGRIKGKYCVTGANVAKYDGWSGMIYFGKHNPLKFTLKELSDYIETGFKWFEKVHRLDAGAKYPFLLWNCLEKSGASQVHGHAQLLMARGRYYAGIEMLQRAALEYAKKRKGGKYFDDLFEAHKMVNLGYGRGGVKVFVSLTPVKEKETVIIASNPSKSDKVKKVIFDVLRCFIDKLGVTCFNVTISMPAMDAGDDLPYIIRVVDRGSIFKATADIGAMELYANSVISTDPYGVIDVLK